MAGQASAGEHGDAALLSSEEGGVVVTVWGALSPYLRLWRVEDSDMEDHFSTKTGLASAGEYGEI